MNALKRKPMTIKPSRCLFFLALVLPIISFGQENFEQVNCNELTISTEFTNVSCYGDNTGSIEINTSGGTDPFQFSINDGSSYLSTNIFDNLSKGLYKISVIDANNCEKNDVVELSEPENVVINLGPDVEIESNSTLSFDAGNGYNEYNWSTGEAEQKIVFIRQVDILTVEKVFVEVIDENGCMLKSETVEVKIKPSASTENSSETEQAEIPLEEDNN